METCDACKTAPKNKFSVFEDAIRSEMKELMASDPAVGISGMSIDDVEYDMLESARKGEFSGVTSAQATTVIENVANSFRREAEAEREFYEQEFLERQLEEEREKLADAANIRSRQNVFERVEGVF